MPNSNIAVPHFEQTGRVTELECAVAGRYLVIDPSYFYFLAGSSWLSVADENRKSSDFGVIVPKGNGGKTAGSR